MEHALQVKAKIPNPKDLEGKLGHGAAHHSQVGTNGSSEKKEWSLSAKWFGVVYFRIFYGLWTRHPVKIVTRNLLFRKDLARTALWQWWVAAAARKIFQKKNNKNILSKNHYWKLFDICFHLSTNDNMNLVNTMLPRQDSDKVILPFNSLLLRF